MNRQSQTHFVNKLRNIPTGLLAWLWWLIGFALLPLTYYQNVIPLAAWLAPIFLLRFSRTTRRGLVALPLIFLAYAAGILIGLRGSDNSNVGVLIYGIIVFPLIRGVMYSLPYAADRMIGARLPTWARMLVFPTAFTTVDWLMSLSSMINSTGSPAYSQYNNLALMQVLSITGMWGITFLIMWGASAVNALWENRFDWRPVRFTVGAFVAVMLAVLIYGSIRLSFFPPSGQTVKAATITLDSAVSSEAGSAVGLNVIHFTGAQRAAIRPKIQPTVDQLLARTETALRGGAKIVTWEEGSATVLEEDKQQTLDRVAALAKQYDAYIQVSIGLVTHIQEQHFIRNQSILIDNTGAVRWTYDKTYPVIPVEAYVVIAGPGQLPVADTPYGRLSTAICNDMHFTPLIHQAGQKGVDILLTPYHDVHPFEAEDAVVATYRAIENGFSLVRPTGAGLSTITDYQGRILASQDYFTTSSHIMLASLPIHGVTTIYSRIGDTFAYLCAAGFIFLTILALLHHMQPASVVQRQLA